MYFKSVILLVIVTLFDVKSYIIYGLHTNISHIMQRIMDIGDGKLSNPDPDLTIGRKNFRDSIILVVKRNNTTNNAMRKYMDLKLTRKDVVKTSLLEQQHDRKVREIMEFLDDHYITTNYLYDEVQRIKRQRQVKDELRDMVEYLEKPDKVKLKAEILKCFNDKKKSEVVKDMYRHKTNNLVINILKDPYNDGFVN